MNEKYETVSQKNIMNTSVVSFSRIGYFGSKRRFRYFNVYM